MQKSRSRPCFRFLRPFTAVKAFFSQTETEIFFWALLLTVLADVDADEDKDVMAFTFL